MATKQEITQILVMLAATYPRFTMTKETTTAYIALLKDMDAEALKAAAMSCAATRDFFPSVHELRQEVIGLQQEAANLPTAYEAWEDLCRAGLGHPRDVRREFLHPLVTEVGKQLGWPRTFPSEYTDQLMADRAHYFKAYEAAATKFLRTEIMLPEVRGYIENTRHRLLEANNGQPDHENTTPERILPAGT